MRWGPGSPLHKSGSRHARSVGPLELGPRASRCGTLLVHATLDCPPAFPNQVVCFEGGRIGRTDEYSASPWMVNLRLRLTLLGRWDVKTGARPQWRYRLWNRAFEQLLGCESNGTPLKARSKRTRVIVVQAARLPAYPSGGPTAPPRHDLRGDIGQYLAVEPRLVQKSRAATVEVDKPGRRRHTYVGRWYPAGCRYS